MSNISYFSMSPSELEEDLTKAMDVTINYILTNKITLGQLKAKKNRLAILLRKKSFWERLFNNKKDEDHLALYIVEVQDVYPDKDKEDEPEKTCNSETKTV